MVMPNSTRTSTRVETDTTFPPQKGKTAAEAPPLRGGPTPPLGTRQRTPRIRSKACANERRAKAICACRNPLGGNNLGRSGERSVWKACDSLFDRRTAAHLRAQDPLSSRFDRVTSGLDGDLFGLTQRRKGTKTSGGQVCERRVGRLARIAGHYREPLAWCGFLRRSLELLSHLVYCPPDGCS